MADLPPPAYDDVVAGTWQQDNNVSQNTNPYPSYPMGVYPAPSVNSGFDNSSLHLSQQSLPQDAGLTTEAPPSYNATMSQDGSTIPVDNFTRQSSIGQSSIRRSSVASVNLDQPSAVVSSRNTNDANDSNDDGSKYFSQLYMIMSLVILRSILFNCFVSLVCLIFKAFEFHIHFVFAILTVI